LRRKFMFVKYVFITQYLSYFVYSDVLLTSWEVAFKFLDTFHNPSLLMLWCTALITS
jgi:hypothetical protein